MNRTAKTAILLIAGGVALNNYAYLHDVVMGSHQGYIYLGPKAITGVVIGILAILGGLYWGFRSPGGSRES